MNNHEDCIKRDNNGELIPQLLTYWVSFPKPDKFGGDNPDLPVLRGFTAAEVRHQIRSDWSGYPYEAPREVQTEFFSPFDLLLRITDPDDALIWELPDESHWRMPR